MVMLFHSPAVIWQVQKSKELEIFLAINLKKATLKKPSKITIYWKLEGLRKCYSLFIHLPSRRVNLIVT
jgi:hypothetical protein